MTYGLSALVRKLASLKLSLDLKKVWQNQQVGPGFKEQILLLGELVQAALTEGAERHNVKNVQEWSKRPTCWDEIAKIDFNVLEILAGELTGVEDANEERLDGRRSQKMLTEAEAQIRVTELGAEYWKQVLQWADGKPTVSPSDLQIIGVAASIPKRIPNAKQSIRLLEISSKHAVELEELGILIH